MKLRRKSGFLPCKKTRIFFALSQFCYKIIYNQLNIKWLKILAKINHSNGGFPIRAIKARRSVKQVIILQFSLKTN
jgi:hypothetical protein